MSLASSCEHDEWRAILCQRRRHTWQRNQVLHGFNLGGWRFGEWLCRSAPGRDVRRVSDFQLNHHLGRLGGCVRKAVSGTVGDGLELIGLG